MNNFFRNLRNLHLQQNKFAKYILYAIGEIILIIIGILVALYLNNLNEAKQTKALEIKLLNELKSNLQHSILNFQRSINSEKDYLSYNEMILDYLDNNKPYNPELDNAFGVYFWTITSNPVTGGYDFLKSKGIDLITNDSLRNKISFIFETEFSIIKNENEVWSNNLQQNISYPYHVEHFRKYVFNNNNSIELAKPFDYDALLRDDKFKSINTEIISNRRWNINSLTNLVKEMDDLVAEIDKELQSEKKN
ncbi:DUF6090 family protein [Aegicerativicinus sediminis]|uniref:DUF6090 family protein n=1 Tax=Aegicerativicinus sediminis TaxID=2893202 RepID=UPI001E638932|nr:DUF6090 family protein [Aegicerativicinus sediminis]